MSAGSAAKRLAGYLGHPAALISGRLVSPQSHDEPRRVPSTCQHAKARQIQSEEQQAAPDARPRNLHYEHYDWALVWRYWHGQAQGLRSPYALEVLELLRLGKPLTDEAMGEQLGVAERTVARWRARYQ